MIIHFIHLEQVPIFLSVSRQHPYPLAGASSTYMLSMMCKFIMVMEGESQRMKNGVGEFINFAEIGGHMLHRRRGMNAPASGSNDDFSMRSGDA